MPFRATINERAEIIFPSMSAATKWQAWKEMHPNALIVLDEFKEDHSGNQLRLYRAWLNRLCEQTGNDPDELHEFLILKCAPVVVSTIKGSKGAVEIEQKKRTSGGHKLSMDKLEMTEFMQRCAALTQFSLPTEEELISMGYIPN
jgi:hypothetical protein